MFYLRCKFHKSYFLEAIDKEGVSNTSSINYAFPFVSKVECLLFCSWFTLFLNEDYKNIYEIVEVNYGNLESCRL